MLLSFLFPCALSGCLRTWKYHFYRGKKRSHNKLLSSSDPHQLTFYLTYILTFYLALWHSLWHMFWHSIWQSVWHLFWQSFWHLFWHSLWHVRFQACSMLHCTRSLRYGPGPLVITVTTSSQRRRRGGRIEGVAPLLKSRDPHLAGGEKCVKTEPMCKIAIG